MLLLIAETDEVVTPDSRVKDITQVLRINSNYFWAHTKILDWWISSIEANYSCLELTSCIIILSTVL